MEVTAVIKMHCGKKTLSRKIRCVIGVQYVNTDPYHESAICNAGLTSIKPRMTEPLSISHGKKKFKSNT